MTLVWPDLLTVLISLIGYSAAAVAGYQYALWRTER